MTRNRILILLAVALVVLLGGFALWWFGVREASPTIDNPGNLPEIGDSFDVQNIENIVSDTTISIESVEDYYVYPNNTVVVVHTNGTVSRIANESVTSLSSSQITGFISGEFSQDGSYLMALSGETPRFKVNLFEVNTASWRTASSAARETTWGPNNTLALILPDEESGQSSIALYDAEENKKLRTLTTLSLGDVSLEWPSSTALFISDKPTAFSRGGVLRVDIASGDVTVLARGWNGFTATWRNATDGIMFRSGDLQRGGSTSLINNGREKALLSFVTIPDKCSFFDREEVVSSSTTPYVLCGVPVDQDQLSRVTLPDAYYREEIFVEDVLIGINLITNEVSFSVAPDTSSDITRLRIVSDEAYYIDRRTHRLHKVSLTL